MYDNNLPPIPPSYLSCKICNKIYNKLGSHAICYKKYCWICGIIFSSNLEQQLHSEKNHAYFYCVHCKECISDISSHKNYKHCIKN